MISLLDTAPAGFHQRVRQALKCWNGRRQDGGLLDDLLIAPRLAEDTVQARRLSTNLLLKQGLAQLAMLSPVEAELLELRFCDRLRVSDTHQQLHYSESTIYFKQNQAIARLAAILFRLETQAWQKRAASLEGRLDTPPCWLIGVDAQIKQLADLLVLASGPWLVSIEGIGGSGKTTLAAAVLRRLAKTTAYAGFGWVSAQVAMLDLCGDVCPRTEPAISSTAVLAALVRQLLPDLHPALAGTGAGLDALRLHLQQYPHVIVIDNFDTVIDPQPLLSTLHSLAGPAKFMLTSRRRLIAESHVYLHRVPELSRADALRLLRWLAQTQDLAPLLACGDEELARLYATVGGNPLALMFALEQMQTRPFQAVVADLAHIRTQPIAVLFDFILHQVWAGLGERERRVLRVLPAAELCCLDVEGIGLRCGLNEVQTTAALQRLVQAGLVQVVGDLEYCRYRLHNLTRTYLRHLAAHARCAAPATLP